MAFSGDGKFLALAGVTKEVEIVNAKTGQPHLTLQTAVKAPYLSFNPDGKTLAIAGSESIELWDVRTGKIKSKMKLRCGKMAFSPNGKWLAVVSPGLNRSGGLKSDISVRDVQSANEICSIAIEGPTRGLAFPRNDLLVHAGSRIVRVFEFSVKKK